MKAPGVDSLVVLWWQRGVMRTLSGARLGAVLATLPLSSRPAGRPGGRRSRWRRPPPHRAVRFQTFNASLNRTVAGELVADLSTPDDPQAAATAEIIQRTRPDVLLLNEFDYVAGGEAVDLFRENYLEVGHNGAKPIHYRYSFIAPSNTGIPSGHDLDNNGSIGGGNDAFGFGAFEGQFGMAVLSKYPIDRRHARTFQEFRWADMPGAMLPDDPATAAPADWYSPPSWPTYASPASRTGTCRSGSGTRPSTSWSRTRPRRSSTAPRTATAPQLRRDPVLVRLRVRRRLHVRRPRPPRRAAPRRLVRDRRRPEQRPARRRLGARRHPAADREPDGSRTRCRPRPAGPRPHRQGGANLTHESDPRYDTADFADNAPGNLRADYVLPSGGSRSWARASSGRCPATRCPG